MSHARVEELTAKQASSIDGARKTWHAPALSRYPAGAAEAVRAIGNVDGGGGAHKDS